MKTKLELLVITLTRLPALVMALFVSNTCAIAQDIPPSSLAAEHFTITVVSGNAPFSTNGQYALYTSPLGTNFVMLGVPEPGLSSGTYSYIPGISNRASAVFVDAGSGLRVSLSLLFGSVSSGQLLWTNVGTTGYQTASFTVSNYTSVTPPRLFSPALTQGGFESYLSGQAGAVYSIDVSSNLLNWSPLTAMGFVGLTGSFTDTNATGSRFRFYRARPTSVDFAPATISGKSLGFTVSAGAAPLATNGIFEMVADSSDTGCQIISGPGLTDSSGTCAYTKLAPGAALLTMVDSQNVTNYLRLVFTSPLAGVFYMTNAGEAGFQSGNFDLANGQVLFLGDYQFVPDPSRAVSLEFASDGNPSSLSVTDAVGNVWTLSLPADALLYPQTITMTPVASIDGSNAVLPAKAAVLLDPDGIRFCDGVTLTLTTPVALGTNASLMSVAEDGSDISLLETTNQDNTYSSTLFHFSSTAVTDPTSQQLQGIANNQALVKQQLTQAENDAKALEDNPPIPPPVPDAEWTCDPASQARAAAAATAYYAALFQQENDVLKRLFTAGNEEGLLGDASLQQEATLEAAVLFGGEMYDKVDFVLADYGSFPANAPVVIQVATAFVKQGRIYAVDTSILAAIANSDLVSLGNYYLNKLVNDHDYSSPPVIFFIAKNIELFGGNNSALIAGVSGALHFQLTIDVTASAVGLNDTVNIEANGQFPITISGASTDGLEGNGTIYYVSGDNFLSVIPAIEGTLAPGQSFSENCTLVLNACPDTGAMSAIFSFPPPGFGSQNETWQFPSPYGSLVITDLLGISGDCFSEYNTGGELGLIFNVPLQNGNAQAVNQTISQQVNVSGTYVENCSLQLTLQHTP
jgi:hypothetical protein